MGKIEAEIGFDNNRDYYRMDYEWNGFLFDGLIKYCVENNVFEDAANITGVQDHFSNRMRELSGNDRLVARSSLNRWRKEAKSEEEKEYLTPSAKNIRKKRNGMA